MTHKRRGGRSAGGRKHKSGGLLIGMRGGIRRAAGVNRVKSSGPGAGGAGAMGRIWTLVTVVVAVIALVLMLRRFT